MSRYSSQDVNEIVDTLRKAKDRGKPAHILFGAGCSKAAGIPLAPEIVVEIHKQYPARCHRLPEGDQHKYGACMKLLSPNERRDLLAPYLAKASINWAHIALAQFMNEKFIERALTVNFDNLLARACGLLSLYPAIYDFASAPTSDVSLIVSPAIVHLHGQGHGVALMHTEEETTAHSTKIAPVLRQSMDHPLIVIGYSGTTDDVLRIFRDYYPGTEYLYWLSRDGNPDASVLRTADNHGYFKCVGGVDADRFLIELARRLHCWPPNICTNPIGHLLDELKPVAEYPTVPGNEVDILLATRGRLVELEQAEKHRPPATRDIQRSLYEGRYDEAAKFVAAADSNGHATDEERKLRFEVLLLAGNRAHAEGRSASSKKKALERLEDAEAKYEAALRLEVGHALALYNLGINLIFRAQLIGNSTSGKDLLKLADGHFKAALRDRRTDPASISSRGGAMLELAKRATNRQKTAKLLNSAVRTMKEAHDLGYPRSYNLACGYALLGRAKDCRAILEGSEKAGTLPPVNVLSGDDDFVSVREQPWFQELIRRQTRKLTK